MTMDVDIGSAGGHDLDEDLDDDDNFGTKAKKGRAAAAKKTTTRKVAAPKSMPLIC
jgi:hypothetical protein